MTDMAAVILAAGQGTRMRSSTPKVLHPILGKPLISFPVKLAKEAGCQKIVAVVGHGRAAVTEAIVNEVGPKDVVFAHQKEQRGTGHAVMTALSKLRGHQGPVLILSGDVPLLDVASIRKLKRVFKQNLAFLTFTPPDPAGYGRVIREQGKPVAIREFKDCSRAERQIGEVNSGIYLIDIGFLRKSIKRLKSNNKQNELYLTDLVAIAAEQGNVGSVSVSPELVAGINDRAELAEAETILAHRRNLELMRSGVTMIRPESVRVEMDVCIGKDTTLMPNVHLSGRTVVGEGCTIGQGSILYDTLLDDQVIVKAYSVFESAHVATGAEVGPMARLRPGADIGPGAKIGNWVEVKNTKMGVGSKANHLSYLGDGVIGDGVNIGAGTIFCNYDGFLKHQTVLGNEVFVGSDSQLVAPVTIEDGAYIASGSTITKDVPQDALAISRTKQSNLPDRASLLKKQLKEEKQRRLKSKKGSAAKPRKAKK